MHVDLRTAGTHEPKYTRLKKYLLEELRSGRLRPGDALPTELELAAELGVARGTVRHAFDELAQEGILSRVRGKGTFVQDQIETLLRRETPPVEKNSRPDTLAVDALVVPETRSGYYPDLLYGFDEAASRHYHQILVSSSDNNLNRQGQIFLQLLQKRVAGVAVVPTSQPTPPFQIQALQNQGIPVVFCHRKVDGVRAPLLAIPFDEIGRRSARALVERGHRRVAVVMSTPGAGTEPLLGGFRAQLAEAEIEFRPSDFNVGDGNQLDMGPHEERISAFLHRTFTDRSRPTAIMTSFDPIAEVIYLQLNRMGLRVPEDVSIISFGGKERRGAILRRVSSVVLDGALEGRRAIEILEEIRAGTRSIYDESTLPLPLEFYEGATLGPAPSP